MIPMIVALIGAEAIERVIKLREYIIFTLQDMAEEGLFYSWILYDAGVVDELDTAIEWLDKVAKAYIYVVGLPLIIARYHKEIQQTPHLYEFFYQFPSAREHLQRTEMGITTYINKIDKELLDNIEKLYPKFQMDEETKKKAEANPLEVFNWLKQNIETLWNAMNQDQFKFVNYCVQNLSQTVYPEFLYNIPAWLVFLLNPFIEIDWVIIKTCITLKWALEHFKLSNLAEQLPRPYIPKMKAKLHDEDEVLAEGQVGADGSIVFETTTDDTTLSDLFINLHGLILRIPVVEIAKKLKLYVKTTDTFIEGLETQWVRIEMFTMPNSSKAWIIGFEDLKGQPYIDFDYEDVLIYVFETEDKFITKLYGTFGSYDNYLYVEGETEPIHCPPRGIGWRKDEIPPDDYLCAILEFDKETITLINVERYT